MPFLIGLGSGLVSGGLISVGLGSEGLVSVGLGSEGFESAGFELVGALSGVDSGLREEETFAVGFGGSFGGKELRESLSSEELRSGISSAGCVVSTLDSSLASLLMTFFICFCSSAFLAAGPVFTTFSSEASAFLTFFGSMSTSILGFSSVST